MNLTLVKPKEISHMHPVMLHKTEYAVLIHIVSQCPTITLHRPSRYLQMLKDPPPLNQLCPYKEP